MGKLFTCADILLPNVSSVDMKKWSCIACDQYTSEPEYWESVKEKTKGAPTTLDLFLPEIYLSRSEEEIPEINRRMKEYENGILEEHKDAMIYLRRTIPDGRIRTGIVGKIDLLEYDYRQGTSASVRATEQTVIERIPPRVAIRRDAVIELPHIMMLYDDKEDSIASYIESNISGLLKAYDFDLIEGAGHIEGYYLSPELCQYVSDRIERAKESGLALCVGDGNHSLASAKALYEEIKADIGEEAASVHPARYALCELVNIHSTALDFEPIHRLVTGVDIGELLSFFKSKHVSDDYHTLRYVTSEGSGEIKVDKNVTGISVDPLQKLLDEYLENSNAQIDYIHGDDSLMTLAKNPRAIGIFCEPISKSGLFEAVAEGGSLPRKTFSMGVAKEKRHYLEARKIR